MLNLRRLDKGFEPTDELSYFNGPGLQTLVPDEEVEGNVVEEHRQSAVPPDIEAQAPLEEAVSGSPKGEVATSSVTWQVSWHACPLVVQTCPSR